MRPEGTRADDGALQVLTGPRCSWSGRSKSNPLPVRPARRLRPCGRWVRRWSGGDP